MRFTFNEEMSNRVDKVVRVGDVYAAKGGNRGTAFWVVAAIGEGGRSAKLLGIDKAGEIVSTQSYNKHTLESRPKIGFARGLEALEFNIEDISL